MLAVVKTPHTEISIHGDGSARILEYLKQQFQIEVLAADDDETLVNIRDSEYWKTEVTPGTLLTGFRLKHGLTQNELAEKSGVSQVMISDYETGKRKLSQKPVSIWVVRKPPLPTTLCWYRRADTRCAHPLCSPCVATKCAGTYRGGTGLECTCGSL